MIKVLKYILFKSIHRKVTIVHSHTMISSSPTNDPTFSMDSNKKLNNKTEYDNLTKSIYYPLNKRNNQQFVNESYDNYSSISNQQQNLGNCYLGRLL